MIELLAANWVWIVAVALFVGMHRRGHGCGMHGSHGGHTGHQGHATPDHENTDHERSAERADTDRSTT